MEHLCLVIDLEGFFLGKHFYVRELGYTIRSGESGVVFFAMPVAYDALSPHHRRIAQYTTRHVHGLPWVPAPEELALPQDRLPDIVRTLHLAHGTPRHHVVAFKGGHIERDLLTALHIPHVDLEQFGCPKTSLLRTQFPDRELWTCDHHPTTHCGQTDAQLYWTWWARKKKLLL